MIPEMNWDHRRSCKKPGSGPVQLRGHGWKGNEDRNTARWPWFGNVFGFQIGFFLRQDIELARLRWRLCLTSFTNRFLNAVCILVIEWTTVVLGRRAENCKLSVTNQHLLWPLSNLCHYYNPGDRVKTGYFLQTSILWHFILLKVTDFLLKLNSLTPIKYWQAFNVLSGNRLVNHW